MNDEFVKLQLY